MRDDIRNIDAAQKEKLDGLLKEKPRIVIRWNEDQGGASLIQDSLVPWREVGKPEEIIPAVIRIFTLQGEPVETLNITESIKLSNRNQPFRGS